jgi:hypothetical protein
MAEPGTKKSRHVLAERQRQELPTLREKREGWGTLKIKGRTKTSQLQDELREWVHRGRGDINEWKHGCEKVGHPPGFLLLMNRRQLLVFAIRCTILFVQELLMEDLP